MHRAIALYSGGLDSILAILILTRQNIQVLAIKFLTGFVKPLTEEDFSLSQKFGFPIKEIDIREKFISVLKNPEHGYGKNLNPCIDCKILMLREAKAMMSEHGASFIVTGEVVSQRPMSQKRELMIHIEKRAGLTGLILRPLSAKLLSPTKVELEGIVNRDMLYDIWGRGRKIQLNLAKQFGIEKIPQPSAGCLLTDPLFCKKVRDLIVHDELTVENIELLKIGRHLRISERCKVILGRNERENEILFEMKKGVLIYPKDMKGPVTLLLGSCLKQDIDKAASICVYYSKRKDTQLVIVSELEKKEKNYDAISEEEIVKYRI